MPQATASPPQAQDPVRIQKSLVACLKEGIVAQVMIGILDYYLIPFALFLGASTQQVGVLVALPNLINSVAQLFAVRAVHLVGSRLRLLLIGVAIQAIALVPVAFLAFFKFPGRIAFLVALVAAFRMMGTVIGPAWGSLVSDHLPEKLRGVYFGWRSKWVGLSGLVGVALWGLVLSGLQKSSSAVAFFAIFACASLFRFLSFYYMSRMTDLPLRRTPDSDFTFWMFIRRFRESNFVKYIFFVASITFATQVAAPYFSVYMLKELKFDYITYMMVQIVSIAAGMFSFTVWGRHADLVGNARILKLTSFVIPLVPVFWIFARHPWHLLVIESFSGFIWSGFNLCATNFIFDAVAPEKRVRCLSYFNLINGVAIFGGASLGGYLATRLPPLFGSAILSLFLLSAVLRFFADFFLSRHFTEVRASAKKVSSAQLFFSVVGLRPLVGRNLDWDVFPRIRRFALNRPVAESTGRTAWLPREFHTADAEDSKTDPRGHSN